MHRRQFLAASGAAAAVPALAWAAETGAPEPALAMRSTSVNFTSDGLELGPVEYATALRDLATRQKLEADNYSLGGAVTALEQWFAERLGKQAAMFVPTGTLANHLAVRKLAGAHRRVLVQAESHLYNDSGDGASTLSGLNLVPLAEGRATIPLDEVKRMVERSRGGRVQQDVGAIAIENPVRRRNHEMVEPGELDRVCRYAREQGIRLHLDGARMFNLPLHSGRSVRDYAAGFDTVYVSLWKHFNGASGAILAGDATFIDGLFHTRRMFGGSLPQAWPQIAPVLGYAERYEDDYARSWQAADEVIALLVSSGRFEARKLSNGTSRFFLKAPGVPADRLPTRALDHGVKLPLPQPGNGEYPLQVNASILRRSPAEIAKVFVDSVTG